VWLIWAFWVFGACDSSDKAETEWDDPYIDTGLPPDRYVARSHNLVGCAQPLGRRYHQMAYFVEPGITFDTVDGSVQTERGAIVYGGVDSSGLPLDDLWLFDLSRWHLDSDHCVWHEISADATATDGIADGALIYAAGAFYLVGGRVSDGGNWRPSESVYSGNVAASAVALSAAGLSVSGSMPDFEVTTERQGSPLCSDDPSWICFCGAAAGCDADGNNAALTQQPVAYLEGDEVGRWVPGLNGDEESMRRAICDQHGVSWGTPGAGDWALSSGLVFECHYVDEAGAGCTPDPLCDDAPIVSGVAIDDVITSIPGVASAGWAWDPANEELFLHGGTAGCSASLDCPSDLGDLMLDHGVDSIEAVNLRRIRAGYINGGTFDVGPLSSMDDAPWVGSADELPMYARNGVRGAAGAVGGRTFDLASKTWGIDLANDQLHWWGGTTQQAVEPAVINDVESATTARVSGTFVDNYGNWFDSAEDQRLAGQWKLRAWDGDWDGRSGGEDDGIFDAALVASEHVLFAHGGLGWSSSGARSIHVLSPSTGNVLADWDNTKFDAFGSRGVYDPIGQRAWFFGLIGTSGNNLISIEDKAGEPHRFPGPFPDVTLWQLEQHVEFTGSGDPTTDAWDLSAAMRLTFHGEAVDYQLQEVQPYSHHVELFVPVLDGKSLEQVQDIVVADIAAEGGPLVEMEVDSIDLDGSVVTLTTPMALVEGVAYELSITLEGVHPAPVQPDGTLPFQAGTTETHLGDACDGSPLVYLDQVVAKPYPWDSVTLSSGSFLVARYHLPDGWSPVSVGALEDCSALDIELLEPSIVGDQCVSLDGTQPEMQMQGHGVYFTPHAVELGTLELLNHGSNWKLRGVADECLQQDLADLVAAYFTSASGEVIDDAEFLTDHLGFGLRSDVPGHTQVETRTTVFFRRPLGSAPLPGSTDPPSYSEEKTAGVTKAGLVEVLPFDHAGTLYADEGEVPVEFARDYLGMVTTHELAHVLMGHRVLPQWASEGIPALLHLKRYPDVQPRRQFIGLWHRISAWVHEPDDAYNSIRDLKEPSVDAETGFLRDYNVAPWLLAQAEAVHAANATDFWATLRDEVLHSDHEIRHEVLDCDDPVGCAPWEEVLGTVYSERLRGEKVGEPLLTFSQLGTAGGEDWEVEMRQFQVDIDTELGTPFDVFSEAPFVLGLRTLAPEGDGAVPYDGSPLGLDAVRLVDTSGSRSWTLARTGEVGNFPTGSTGGTGDTGDTGGPPQSAFDGVAGLMEAALFANHLMLNTGSVEAPVWTAYGVTPQDEAQRIPPAPFLADPFPPTWLRLCGPHVTTAGGPGCSDDDGDGYGLLADCGPTLPQVHPTASEPAPWALGDLDDSCDGWPVDLWQSVDQRYNGQLIGEVTP